MDTNLLNDLLECSVCLKPLDEQNKVLPCQHTFCKSCLFSIVKSHKELRCPECRVLVRHRVEDLPSNILLIRLLDGIKLQQVQTRVSSRTDVHETRRHSVEGVLSEPASKNSGDKDGGNKLSRHSDLIRPSSLHERAGSEPASNKVRITTPRPEAQAIFPYESAHPGDLSFAKGDTIHLLRKIDANWLSGECHGRTGVFPLSYVKIVHPLPIERPYCTALYDFESDQNEPDRDCIQFTKNDKILVIRKVDENWAEGMLKEKIGIFPLSFVKLSDEARLLIEDMSSPPEPKEENRSHRSGIIGAAARKLTSTKQGGKNAKKRHSFPTFLSDKNKDNSVPSTSYRHSMEFGLSSSTIESSSSNSSNPTFPPLKSEVPTTSASLPPLHTSLDARQTQKVDSQIVSSVVKTTEKLVPARTGTPKVQPPINVTTTSSSNSTALQIQKPADRSKPSERSSSSTKASAHTASKLVTPAKIVTASYTYQALKPDELDLIKGDSYCITEVCNDGWCRGTHVRSGKAGAFPGNYVSPKPVMVTAATKSSASSRSFGDPSSVSASGQLVPNRTYEQYRQQQQQKVNDANKSNLNPTTGQTNPIVHKTSPSASPRPTSAPIKTRPVPSKLVLPPKAGGPGNPRPSSSTAGAKSSVEKPSSIRSPPPRPVVPEVLKVRSDGQSSSNSNQARKTSPKSPASAVKPFVEEKARKRAVEKDRPRDRRNVLRNMISGGGKGKPKVPVLPATSSPQAGFSGSPSTDAHQSRPSSQNKPSPKPLTREKYYAIMNYPANGPEELNLKEGDLVIVHNRNLDGWCRGTHVSTGKTGHFPATFVERVTKDL
ncbi:unnamed protein product [Clavelina lepadiformis]|uniref:Uncharacterized protein n=1 Tax=Clavelina lepadiformis TaxID=159417 RepID=A0ABP0FXL5_CLALP